LGNTKKVVVKLEDEEGNDLGGQLSLKIKAGPKLHDWIHVFERGLLKISNARLNCSESSLLYFILAQVDYGNEFWCQSSLCWAVTGIRIQHQARCLHALQEKGLITPKYKIGKKQVYELNPCLAWKGSARQYPGSQYLRIADQAIEWTNEILDHRTGERLDVDFNKHYEIL
jgi:hypothetical protein